MQKKTPEERFQINIKALSTLVQELINDTYQKGYDIVHPDLVALACGILVQFDRIVVIENFIDYSFLYWEEIREGKESYFIEHAGLIFKDLPTGNVGAFRALFGGRKENGENIICQEDRLALIVYFQTLVKISIHYIQEHWKEDKRLHLDPLISSPMFRYCTYREECNTTTTVNAENAKIIEVWYRELDLPKIAALWNVKL